MIDLSEFRTCRVHVQAGDILAQNKLVGRAATALQNEGAMVRIALLVEDFQVLRLCSNASLLMKDSNLHGGQGYTEGVPFYLGFCN